MMTEQEQAAYFNMADQRIREAELGKLRAENTMSQMSSFPPTKEPNIVEYQLDLKEELDRIHHLISGHVLTRDNDNNEVWHEPLDDRLKIFSEYGVKQIMNIISFYINRNTLLSNYDAETIMWKVRDFGIELADLIYTRYEVFFAYPTPEELFEKHYTQAKLQGITDYELYLKCIKWSNDELRQKIRHFPMIVLSLVDTVHSTYLRALNGEERETLRKIIHVSQNTSTQGNQTQQNKFSMLKPSTW